MRPDIERTDSTAVALPESDALPEETRDRLARILDDYLVAMELGSPISPEELLARHPDDAAQLRGYLSGLELFHAAAAAPNGPQPVSLVGGRLRPEQTIGDFRLVREIGRGGMGVVYEAEQISLRRRVALKILPFTAGHDEKQIGRFKNEAQAAAQIKHPNIVPVYAVGEENGVHFYAMQLVEGESLTTLLEQMQHGDAPSSVGTGDHVRVIARLGAQAAQALHAAHEYGIVHRDVKPSNLLVDDAGKLWVTDFGLARCRESVGLTQTGDVLGTMRYMSPEQALGRAELIDHRTDVYSLGVTLYELATLHHPAGDVTDAQLLMDRRRYASKPLRHWNRHIPVDFQTIILKAIAEFPHERYTKAQELADDLNRFLDGEPILASPPSLATRAGKWARRHRGVVYAAAAVLLVAFVGQWINTWRMASQTAETNRALAASQHHLRQAHAVLDRFGTQLVDELESIPEADVVRAQLLNDSLSLYEQFAVQAAGEASLESDLATAYSKMGSLQERMERNDEAFKKYLAARKIWQARALEEPADIEAARNLARCDNNIGHTLDKLGRVSEALAALQQAERSQSLLTNTNRASLELATELATTRNNLGLVMRQLGRREDATEHFRAAIAQVEPVIDPADEDETSLRVLAASYNNLGSLLDAVAGDEAPRTYQQAIALGRQLVEHQPLNREYQGDLARSYNNLGFLLARRHDWQNAELCYRDAIRIQEHLVQVLPRWASYRGDLAISYNNLGMVESHDRRYDAAEASFKQAVSLQQTLLEVNESDAQTLSNQGGVYNNLGLLFDRQQRYADAESAYREAIEFQKQALAAAPSVTRYRELLGNHYANYAKCLESQQKQQAADQVVAERESLLAGLRRSPVEPTQN